jgi:hypothetical protein
LTLLLGIGIWFPLPTELSSAPTKEAKGIDSVVRRAGGENEDLALELSNPSGSRPEQFPTSGERDSCLRIRFFVADSGEIL